MTLEAEVSAPLYPAHSAVGLRPGGATLEQGIGSCVVPAHLEAARCDECWTAWLCSGEVTEHHRWGNTHERGSCFPGYLYCNGYIPANRINSVDANGKPNGIEGVPANYKPSTAPLIPQGQTALPPNAPAGTNVSSFWDTNNVWIPLSNGTVQRVVYNNNLNPWRNQYVPLPWQWFQDVSAFKFIAITEKVNLRFNVDFFNVFNHPNNPTSITDTGILSTRNSGSSARTTQLGVRLQR